MLDELRVESVTYPLSRERFAFGLRRARGRALLHVQRHGANGVADLILAAITRDDRYDRQVDPWRAAWLARLVAAARLQDRAVATAEPFIAAAEEHGYAEEQALDFVTELALAGHADARRVVRETFARGGHEDIACTQWVRLEGEKAFREAARVYLGPIDPAAYDADPKEHASAMWNAQRWGDGVLDNPTVERLLEEEAPALHAIESARLSRARAEYEQKAAEADRQEAQLDASTATAEQILELMRERHPGEALYAALQARVSTADILVVLEECERTPTKRALGHRVLMSLRDLRLPTFDEGLVRFLSSESRGISRTARDLVGSIRAPEVRALALADLAAAECAWDAMWALHLLRCNVEPGDLSVVAKAVLSHATSDEGVHDVVGGIDRLCDGDLPAAFAPLVLWAYEYSLCAYPGRNLVAWLEAHDAAPAWLLEELPLNVPL